MKKTRKNREKTNMSTYYYHTLETEDKVPKFTVALILVLL